MGQGSSTTRANTEGRVRRRLQRSDRHSPSGRATDGVERLQEEVEQSLLGANTSQRGGGGGGGGGGRPRDGSRLSAPVASFRRQISAHSAPLRRPSDTTDRGQTGQDEVVYEHEERPLMSVEDIRIGDAQITHIEASPMPRPPSVIARIGSRLSQRYSSIEPGTFDADDAHERWEHSPLPGSRRLQNVSTADRHRRRSMFGSLADAILPGSHVPRSRRRIAPISRPIPMENSAQYELIGAARQAPIPNPILQSEGTVQRSRLSRVRRSISGPLEALLASSASRNPNMRPPTPIPPREAGLEPSQDEMEYLLPPLDIADSAINLEERSVDVADDMRARADTPIPGSSPRSSWAERLANRSPTMRREPRRVPNLLRGRSSRLIRRDDETPLSRILQLAAATIAAQLSGGSDALSNLEPVGDDQFDGGLNNFVEELNHAAGSVQDSPEGSSSAAAAAAPSLNFWRVFRFVGPNSQRSSGPPEDGTDPRTVTLVVVGVRSVPSSTLQDGVGGAAEPGLESLWDMSSIPSSIPAGRPSRSASLLRNLSGRSRLTTRGHRSSMSDVDAIAPRIGMQRSSEGTRPRSTIIPQTAFSPTESRDSPPGPRPPPTTPAELAPLSARSSSPPALSRSESTSSAFVSTDASSDLGLATSEAASTPRVSRRNTRASRRSANAAASTLASSMSHDLVPDGDNIPTIPDNVQVRQRRRSDSEQARSRNLASHRNGTIDPDGGPTQRSWLIYVVGTNLPENHPAFLTPSLFSDASEALAIYILKLTVSQNPTYEDLINLQNLIGVVKPRVADEDDVANAGGVYVLTAAPEDDGSLIATSVDTGEQLVIPVADACIVCLEPYAAEQQVRRLSKCDHVFHRDCVDHWLLSGCNSCPLCRGKGVEKSAGRA